MSMNGEPEVLAGDGSSSADVSTLEAFRRELTADLPLLLDRAIRNYSRFAAGCLTEDTKSFVAYQTGCRAALAHVHLLVKLAHWARSAGDDDSTPLDAERLEQMVREAEDALANEALDLD
jgi:hypothetical protein